MSRRFLLVLASAVVLAITAVAFGQMRGDAIGKQFSLPMFTREGFRSMWVRAAVGQMVEPNRIELADMHLTLFTGDASNRIETIIISPNATFLPTSRIARGENSVRLIRDEVDASGEKWTYHHAEKRISLQGNVRVVFTAELTDILK